MWDLTSLHSKSWIKPHISMVHTIFFVNHIVSLFPIHWIALALCKAHTKQTQIFALNSLCCFEWDMKLLFYEFDPVEAISQFICSSVISSHMHHTFPSRITQIIYRCVSIQRAPYKERVTKKKLSRHEATCRANCLYMEIWTNIF